MRRVGKSTALKHLLSKVKHKNKVYIDLEKIEWRNLFSQDSYDDIQSALEVEGIIFSKPCVIGLDEIQLVPQITSVIKYFYDTYNIKFIATGSSSFYIKNRFSESLAGRKKIFEVYPLNFDEYLQFVYGKKINLEKYRKKNINKAVHNKYSNDYNQYIAYGGFPEVVLAETDEDRNDYLSDIINSYISLDIILLSDFEASQDLYKLLQLLSSRIGSKLDVTKISSRIGIPRRKTTEYLQLLEHTYFLQTITPYTKSKDVEISKARKIYFADTGLIRAFNKNCPTGHLFENKVFNQLQHYNLPIQYYQKKTGQEIDFIIDQETAYEVKETPISSDYNILERRANALGIKKHKLIGRYQSPSYDDFIWGGNV